MKKISLVVALLLGAAVGLAADEESSYRLTQDGKSESFRLSVKTISSGLEIRETQGAGGPEAEERITLTDGEGDTRSFHFSQPAAGTDYTVARSGRVITATGRLHHRPLRRDFTIDDRPWRQALETALASMARRASGRPERFWFLNADECELVEMEAAPAGRETIALGPEPVEAVKLRVNLTGFASLFWSAHYWFRAADFAYLRYETAAGLGGPGIVIEREEEKKPRMNTDGKGKRKTVYFP